MRIKPLILAAVVAVGALATQAQANFITLTPTITTSDTTIGQSEFTFTPVVSTIEIPSIDLSRPLVRIGLERPTGPPADTGSISYTIDVDITGGDLPGSFTVEGVLSLSNFQTNSGIQGSLFNTFSMASPDPPSVNLGNYQVFITDLQFVAPDPVLPGETPAQGAIGATITAIPEPTSMVLFGAGAVLLGGFAYRRRQRPSAA